MSVLEWTRRRLHLAEAPRPIDALREGGARGVSGLPIAWEDGVRTFYDQLHELQTACVGTACASARHALSGNGGSAETPGIHCLGRCYEAPASILTRARPIPRCSLAPTPVVLRHVLGPTRPLDDYSLPDGETILARLEASGLRGRGGAAYPTAAKWRVAARTEAPDRFVVANGDEGDPGSYVDRLLLEEAPHSVLAGMLACARAIGASRGIVFVRGEYPEAAKRVSVAIEEATATGALDGFAVSVLVGAGSYVAGEETALLRSIEGLRAEPSPKPPFPAERGLYGLPTVVQNIETLSVVPAIVRAETPAGQTGARSEGRAKAVCVSGAVVSPGVVEIELGAPLRDVLVAGAGGAPAGRSWKMALVGGPMGRVVAAHEFDVALSYDALPGMGHGGIVVFDETVRIRRLAEHLFAFAASESCGACTPCRVGTAKLKEMRTVADLERLMETLEMGSMCGFGQGAPRPIRDLVRLYGSEVLA